MNLSFTHSNSAPAFRGHISEFDGMRALAIFGVMINHFWPMTGAWERWMVLAWSGWIGVDLFFVLSGFLITGILLETKEEPRYFTNFYARRMLRIFPLYYLFLLVAFSAPSFVSGGLFNRQNFTVYTGSPWWYIFYIGNFHIAFWHRAWTCLDALWSLSIEEQFYLVFPLLVYYCNERQLRRIIYAVLILAPLVRVAVALSDPRHGWWRAYTLTPCRIDVIALGVLLALEMRYTPERLRRLPLRWILAGLATAVLTIYCINLYDVRERLTTLVGFSVIDAFFFFAVYFVLSRRDQPVTGFLRTRPLRFIGKISYGIYIWSEPPKYMWPDLSEKYPLLMFAAKTVGSIAVAVISWYAFERPILRLKSWFRPQHHPKREPGTASGDAETAERPPHPIQA